MAGTVILARAAEIAVEGSAATLPAGTARKGPPCRRRPLPRTLNSRSTFVSASVGRRRGCASGSWRGRWGFTTPCSRPTRTAAGCRPIPSASRQRWRQPLCWPSRHALSMRSQPPEAPRPRPRHALRQTVWALARRRGRLSAPGARPVRRRWIELCAAKEPEEGARTFAVVVRCGERAPHSGDADPTAARTSPDRRGRAGGGTNHGLVAAGCALARILPSRVRSPAGWLRARRTGCQRFVECATLAADRAPGPDALENAQWLPTPSHLPRQAHRAHGRGRRE